MATFPAFITHRLAGGASAALLVLGCSVAHAQAGPQPAPARQPAPQNVAYYVDGQPTSQVEMSKIAPDDIQSIDVLKGAQARQQLGLAAREEGAVLITTKAGASSPAVMAFNQRFPKTPATPAQTAAVAAAQAYIRQHYPAAKVEFVAPAKTKADRYTAVYEENGQRKQLLFDGQGHVVAQ